MSEEASPPEKSKKKTLPITILKEISTTIFCTKIGKLKLMTFKNMFSADCISSEFCQVVFFAMAEPNSLVEMFLHIFGRYFSRYFFKDIFLHILFGRQMSLKRLFGRDALFLFAKCLFRASSVSFFEANFGREIV